MIAPVILSGMGTASLAGKRPLRPVVPTGLLLSTRTTIKISVQGLLFTNSLGRASPTVYFQSQVLTTCPLQAVL